MKIPLSDSRFDSKQFSKDTRNTEEQPIESAPISLTGFMLVKTTPEWLGFSIDERFTLLAAHIVEILPGLENAYAKNYNRKPLAA